MAVPLRRLFRYLTPNFVQNKTFFLSPIHKRVVLDQRKQAFIYEFDKGEAQVNYKIINGTYDLAHTVIPEKFRGHGLGVSVAKNVLDYCLRNNIKVKLTCVYLQRYYLVNAQRYTGIVV